MAVNLFWNGSVNLLDVYRGKASHSSYDSLITTYQNSSMGFVNQFVKIEYIFKI